MKYKVLLIVLFLIVNCTVSTTIIKTRGDVSIDKKMEKEINTDFIPSLSVDLDLEEELSLFKKEKIDSISNKKKKVND